MATQSSSNCWPKANCGLRPLADAIREAQAIVRELIKGNRSLADELMRERKQEAARE